MKNSPSPFDLIEQWGRDNKPPTLYQIIHDQLGYSHDCSQEIVDAVAKWLPKESSGSVDTIQWNKCVRLMNSKLQ